MIITLAIGMTFTDGVTYADGVSLDKSEALIAHNMQESMTTMSTDPNVGPANCRYGIAGTNSAVAWFDTLSAGTYINFSAEDESAGEHNADFVRVIWVSQRKDADENYLQDYYANPSGSALTALVQQHPGSIWIIGNEIDRVGQGEIHADVYATAYHELHTTIKQADPTAQVAISGLVQFTPNRESYLTMVWDAYQQQYVEPMPVDVWNMHVYVLSELDDDGNPGDIASTALGTDHTNGMWDGFGNTRNCNDPNDNMYCRSEHDNIEIFTNQIVNMRRWMAERGQQQKPLVLSEFGLLYPYWEDGGQCGIPDEFGNCFDPERTSEFLRSTVQWLETASDPALGYGLDNDKLVQQWMWYSLHKSHIGSASNLLDGDYNDAVPGSESVLTLQGQTFMQEATNQPMTSNLVIERVNVNDGQPVVLGLGGATVDVRVSIRNNGNTAVNSPMTVTIYSDAAQTNPIGDVVIEPVIHGCARSVYDAVIEWTIEDEGLHNFYVDVDSADSITESNEADNTDAGFVLVEGADFEVQSIFLPMVLR